MHRNFEGEARNGWSWFKLANMASGSQSSGVTGIGDNYLASPRFLQGDGGWKRVVWMTKKLHQSVPSGITNKDCIATEEDVTTIEELKSFLEK